MRINLLDIDITTVHMLFKPMEFDWNKITGGSQTWEGK